MAEIKKADMAPLAPSFPTSPAGKKLEALRLPMERLNTAMKVILCDALVQQPGDPFQFVADRLRAVDPEASKRKAKGNLKKSIPTKGLHDQSAATVVANQIKKDLICRSKNQKLPIGGCNTE